MTLNNLTLYTTSAVLILDSDGNRVIAKYYQPPHAANFLSTATPAQQNQVAATTPQLSAKNSLATLKEQRAFEKAIFDKTKRATGDIVLYDSHLVLFKASLDVIFYVIGPAAENELMLSGLLSAFYDATSMLVRHQVEKRAILENLDLVTLALDETVDDGIILETDSTTIASRVSRPRPDVNEIQINEQSKYRPSRLGNPRYGPRWFLRPGSARRPIQVDTLGAQSSRNHSMLTFAICFSICLGCICLTAIMSAYSSLKERVAQRILQGGL